MKKLSVIVLMLSGLLIAGLADAAPKKRTRNANRVGPYAGVMVSMTTYTSEQEVNEQGVIDFFGQQGVLFDNVVNETDDSNIGYEAVFGYRFNRYIAAELGLLQVGEVTNTLRGDFGTPPATEPGSVTLDYDFGGPVLAAIGILPLNNKIEFFGRAGVMFATADRGATLRVGGDGRNLGGVKGDSTELVYGIGAQFHVNVMFTIRAEYMVFTEVGDPSTTGTEDLNNMSLGLVVRF